MATVSAQYSIVLRVEIDHRPGMLGRVATPVGAAGGVIGSVDVISADAERTLRDITVDAAGEDHTRRIGAAVGQIDGARLIDTTDRTFHAHIGGKIEQRNKLPVSTRDDLSMAYTPGVARGLQRDCGGPREGLSVHDQAQYRRRRLRRDRRPRPRRHRPRGGDARHGGQVRAVQGLRRRGRVPDLRGRQRP
jgi:hypothetical protein